MGYFCGSRSTIAGERRGKRGTDDADHRRIPNGHYLRAEASFDVVAKPLKIGGHSALLLMIDGFVKDDIMEKVMQFFLSAQEEDLVKWPTPDLFAEAMIPYVEVDTQTDVPTVLSGTVACLLDGYDAVFMIDARTYPVRGVGEPDDDRVLRGARDGFVETLVFNTAMVRRRIRAPQLTMEIFQVGKTSKTDVVLCYMADKADVPAAPAGTAENNGYPRPDYGSGKPRRISAAEAMVQSLSAYPLYRAPGLRGSERVGRPYPDFGGQYAVGHDPSHGHF